MSQRVVIIGAGNLATRLSTELKKAGYIIAQVYSRTISSARTLGQRLGTGYTSDLKAIVPDADIYFVALSDSAFEEVLPHVNFNNHLLVHCSGSLHLNALLGFSARYGVFYPLQTFSKNQELEFRQIPVFVEGCNKEVESFLLNLAGNVSEKVSVLESERRIYLHVAAVFACNFVNHLYTVSFEVLKSQNIRFDVLHPLIQETASKVLKLMPAEAQTGPAVRYDQNIILKHLERLEDFPEYLELYKKLSDSIHQYHKK